MILLSVARVQVVSGARSSGALAITIMTIPKAMQCPSR